MRLRLLSSRLPHPMTVHIVPGLIRLKSGGGKHTGNRLSWNAMRVASYVQGMGREYREKLMLVSKQIARTKRILIRSPNRLIDRK